MNKTDISQNTIRIAIFLFPVTIIIAILMWFPSDKSIANVFGYTTSDVSVSKQASAYSPIQNIPIVGKSKHMKNNKQKKPFLTVHCSRCGNTQIITEKEYHQYKKDSSFDSIHSLLGITGFHWINEFGQIWYLCNVCFDLWEQMKEKTDISRKELLFGEAYE